MISYKEGLYSVKLLDELILNISQLQKEEYGGNCIVNIMKKLTNLAEKPKSNEMNIEQYIKILMEKI